MAKVLEDVSDPMFRAHCATMEALANSWRNGVRVINEQHQALALVQSSFPFIDDEPNFKSHLSASLAAARRLGDVLREMRHTDAMMRTHGFDARRAGKPVTANPYVVTREYTDDEKAEWQEDYEVSAKSRAAIPWYIGWKQGARAGEGNFP